MNKAAVGFKAIDKPTALGGGAIAAFDAYWYGLPKTSGLPLMQDFRPAQLRLVMPHLMIKDVLREPLDFRFRLVGSALIEEIGKDNSGRKFSEIENYGPESHIWENNEFVVEERLISSMHIPCARRTGDFSQIRQSSYPFSETGTDVDYIVTVIEFHAPTDGR